MRPFQGGAAASAPAAVMGLLAAVLATARMPAEPAGREVYDPTLYGFAGPRGCVLPSTPPGFRAMAMRASSPAEAESLAWRLGLAGTWEDDLYVCLLQGDGALVWAVGPRTGRDVRIPGGPVSALVHREYQPEDPELPMGLWPLRRPEPPRSSAPGEPGVFRCPIALVRSVDRIARQWPPAKSGGEDVPLLRFGSWIELPDLGARARRGAAGGWTEVLVMEPSDRDGWAARWLEERGPGWIGFELPFMDLTAARRGLESRGLEPRALGGDRALWLPPSETGGALVVITTGAGF